MCGVIGGNVRSSKRLRDFWSCGTAQQAEPTGHKSRPRAQRQIPQRRVTTTPENPERIRQQLATPTNRNLSKGDQPSSLAAAGRILLEKLNG